MEWLIRQCGRFLLLFLSGDSPETQNCLCRANAYAAERNLTAYVPDFRLDNGVCSAWDFPPVNAVEEANPLHYLFTDMLMRCFGSSVDTCELPVLFWFDKETGAEIAEI